VAGRHSKYTEDIVTLIENCIAAGMSCHKTVEAVGISENTFYKWMRKTPRQLWTCNCKDGNNKELIQVGSTLPQRECNLCGASYEKKLTFADRVNRARALGQLQLLSTIQKASKHTWQAAAWLLERTNPKDFGKRQMLDLSTSNSPLQIDVKSRTKNELLAEAKKLAAAICEETRKSADGNNS